MTAVIQTKNLTKTYGRHQGIEDVGLEVHEGEVYGFLGPNGAGKTTTIRLLLDLIRPTSGRIRVLGLDPRRDGVEIRERLGYLPGELPPAGRDSAESLLDFFASAYGGVNRARITGLAERLELDLSRKVRGLSKGNRQKVGLVQTFMHDPDLLILDEPTSGLDPLVQQTFLELVREARARGQTVFMSSHVLEEVQQVADRAAIIRDGRVVAVESVASLAEQAPRRVEIRFQEPVPGEAFTSLEGVRELEVDGEVVRCLAEGALDELVKTAATYTVVDMLSTEPDLEEIFLRYYTEENDDAAHTAA